MRLIIILRFWSANLEHSHCIKKMACWSHQPLLLASPPSSSHTKSFTSEFVPTFTIMGAGPTPRMPGAGAYMASSMEQNDHQNPTKLVTFLGKGGSGKTTSAVFAAQHYAKAGLKTCLVIHSQDPTAEYLLNCKIGTSPITCSDNLQAVRLETTKMLLEPLGKMKQADARLNLTQGVLEGVVGEELGVLPGMDSAFSALSLARMVGFFANVAQRKNKKDRFDVIIYDGLSTEEMIRIMGATSKARLYLKYLRNLAERTELGRLAAPTLLSLVDEAIGLSQRVRGSYLNGKLSAELWDNLEKVLEKGSSVFQDPHRFGCYLVMDPDSPTSLKLALRYWGCAIQAGAQVSGALGRASSHSLAQLPETVENNFLPLPFAFLPPLSMNNALDWNKIMLNDYSKAAQELLNLPSHDSVMTHSVRFNPANKSITLLMPGFDKSEIKLYQSGVDRAFFKSKYRGGSELLVEAGDQRRVICLPSQIQGKVSGAKFVDRSLVITMR